jgi:Ca-activated chloride channel family protein
MSSVVPGTTQSKLELARNTASDALQYFTDDDQMGLSEFSTTLDGTPDSYKALVPLATVGKSGSAGDRRTALTTAYQHLQPQHGTALYDAVLSAYTDAQAHYLLNAVNVVVVLTDGDDATSKISLATLLSELKSRQNPAQPVHVVTIAYGADANDPVLRQIAAATGGASFSAKDPRSIGTVFISALAAVDH